MIPDEDQAVGLLSGTIFCENSNSTAILQAPWNEDFFRELANFPEGGHDDIVDSLSGAFLLSNEFAYDLNALITQLVPLFLPDKLAATPDLLRFSPCQGEPTLASSRILYLRCFAQLSGKNRGQVGLIDLLRNYISLLKLPFLASFPQNFSTVFTNTLSKFCEKSAQKASIFSSKANYARGLLTL